MDQQDRLAYEVAMAALRDAREDCLRSLADQQPVVDRRRPARWFDARHSPVKRPIAS